MTQLSELLTSPGLDTLSLVTGDDVARLVSRVAVLDDARQFPDVAADSLVLLTPVLAREAYGYQLDIWCRTAAERGVAGMLLCGVSVKDIPRSSIRIAKRSQMALGCVPEHDLGTLVLAIGRALEAGAAEALSRVVRTADHLGHEIATAPAERLTTARLCKIATDASGHTVVARQPEPGELSAPVTVDGVDVDHVVTARPTGVAGQLARLVVQLTAQAASRAAGERQRATELPIRSQTQLLSEILMAGPQYLAELLPRARSLGVAIDSWHSVVVVEVDTSDLDAVTASAFQEALGAVVMQAVGHAGRGTGLGEGSGWHLAFADHVPVLVHTWQTEPRTLAAKTLRTTVEAVHAELRRRWPDRTVRCGVGGSHDGVEGLRSSWAEARAALVAGDDTPTGPPAIVHFDDLGLHRTLVEWYTTQTARAAVHDLLAPLERDGPEKAAMMVRTLRVYLDHQGAVAPTAAELSLHRNAVSYRIKRILSLLDVDLADPDQRLALHLACRAWKLG